MVGSSSSCALLLASQPSVESPKQLSKTCQTLHLNFQENTDDIKRFLLPEIEYLIQNDLLCAELSAEYIATLISSRANGMFLWARLLIEYLRLPVWTLRERQDAIFGLSRLEGLDALYDAILASLKSHFPRKSHSTITRIFQWAMRARRPLKINELAIAVYLETRDGFSTSENENVAAERCLDAVPATYSTLLVPVKRCSKIWTFKYMPQFIGHFIIVTLTMRRSLNVWKEKYFASSFGVIDMTTHSPIGYRHSRRDARHTKTIHKSRRA